MDDSYGNVPEEDVVVVRRLARMASYVAQTVSSPAPEAWKAITYELVLEATLRDWVENGTDDLDADDAEDLSQIVRASVDIAMEEDYALRDTAYRVILGAWLNDWVANWNAEE